MCTHKNGQGPGMKVMRAFSLCPSQQEQLYQNRNFRRNSEPGLLAAGSSVSMTVGGSEGTSHHNPPGTQQQGHSVVCPKGTQQQGHSEVCPQHVSHSDLGIHSAPCNMEQASKKFDRCTHIRSTSSVSLGPRKRAAITDQPCVRQGKRYFRPNMARPYLQNIQIASNCMGCAYLTLLTVRASGPAHAL